MNDPGCSYGSECYFKDYHGIDRRVARKEYEDGTVEWARAASNLRV